MNALILTTYDWVPPPPRGFVRDFRIRWALEEAGLPYRVESTPFENRPPAHFAHQPFGQIPWLTDGDQSIFESGAILLHLGELSDRLMPREAKARAVVQEWVIAALNSVEMATQPWVLYHFWNETDGSGFQRFDDWTRMRLGQLETVLGRGDWLAGAFSVADILMADVLRIVDRFDGLADFPVCRGYVARATGRPAFKKAYDDQMAHFAAADAARGG